MKNECEIVRDLLPLYAEKMTSDASNELIETHLKTCAQCRELLAEMTKDAAVDESQEPELPLKAFSKTYHRKKRGFALFIGALCASVLIALYAWLSTPQYLHYEHAIETKEEQSLGVLIDFTDAVHHVKVTDYSDPDSGMIYADVECWTTVLDQLWNAPAAMPASVQADVVYYRDNYKNSPGRVLYGNPEGYSFSLRRLTLNYYFWMALSAALVCAVAAFVLRKRKAGEILTQLFLIPVSWCIASIIVEGGISASTWSITRDFSLILLLCITLSITLLCLYRIRKEKQSVANAA